MSNILTDSPIFCELSASKSPGLGLGKVIDAPTPFLNDRNIGDAIAYDVHQLTMTAYIFDARGKKSDISEVWTELQACWNANPALWDFENRNEHIICAVHGWTLEEVYLAKSGKAFDC